MHIFSNYPGLNLYVFVICIYVDGFSSFVVILTSCCGCCTVSPQDGWSSLMVASENGHMEVVDKLVQHGARVDLQDNVNTVIFKVS